MDIMTLSLKIFDKVAQSNEGAKLHLVNPETQELCFMSDDDSLPLTISLLGTHSSAFTSAKLDAVRANRKKNTSKHKNAVITQHDLDNNIQEAAELYASLTTGWENMPAFDGNGTMEFTKDNAVKLYTDYLDIRVQVGDFIATDVNFI